MKPHIWLATASVLTGTNKLVGRVLKAVGGALLFLGRPLHRFGGFLSEDISDEVAQALRDGLPITVTRLSDEKEN